MIREKPILNRHSVIEQEAARSRSVRRLLRMVDLLGPDEELAHPVRMGNQIVVPIIPNQTPRARYRDIVKVLARTWQREENTPIG